MNAPSARQWRIGCAAALGVALLATLPTTNDLGLTWDEPAYRYSQDLSADWWARLVRARSLADLQPLFNADALLYYWPYGRHGINFHPPLAGQLNLLTHAVAGGFWKDAASRRLATVLEYAATIAILFGFISGRRGFWAGGIAAGSLLFMPRVYGDGHVATTDMPGLLLWAITAVAFWKGLRDEGAGRWRVAVGVLLGLAFLEKMAAIAVLIPLLGWLAATRLPSALRRGHAADRIDGIVTMAILLAPTAVAFREILRLATLLPPPARTDLFRHRPPTDLPGAILAAPLALWLLRRLMARFLPKHPIWGAERPALEILAAIAAFAPVVGWLGNPAWWRETLPRLAHYYMLNTARRGALPDIRIAYLGRIYEYSLPWPNGWVLVAITVPATILAAGLLGLVGAFRRPRADPLPVYLVAHLVTIPILRMLPTPAHDGVRLMLPTFFFLAALAGLGAAGLGDRLAVERSTRLANRLRAAVALAVLGPAAWQLVAIHPYELSYYNELIGGPRGAWRRGFELAYWYDAFDTRALDEINRMLPPGAVVIFPNELSAPSMVFDEHQALGHLRADIRFGPIPPGTLPHVWLLTHDSKATPFSRLLFAMAPRYVREPRQLGGARVIAVADPIAVARALALQSLVDAPPAGKSLRPRVDEAGFAWARDDPDGLRAAARNLIAKNPADDGVRRLQRLLDRHPDQADTVLNVRPEALAEAVNILIRRPDAVRAVLLRELYVDPSTIGGYLDAGLAASSTASGTRRATP